MNGRMPNTPGAWANFIDAWAQYHNVSMSENARAALANGFGGLASEELAAIQAQPLNPRSTVTLPHPITREPHEITYRPEQPVVVQPIAKPNRIMRTPPRPTPADKPTTTRARIIRRTGGGQ